MKLNEFISRDGPYVRTYIHTYTNTKPDVTELKKVQPDIKMSI